MPSEATSTATSVGKELAATVPPPKTTMAKPTTAGNGRDALLAGMALLVLAYLLGRWHFSLSALAVVVVFWFLRGRDHLAADAVVRMEALRLEASRNRVRAVLEQVDLERFVLNSVGFRWHCYPWPQLKLDVETCHWVNEILTKAWPSAEPLLSEKVKAAAEPILETVSTGMIVRRPLCH